MGDCFGVMKGYTAASQETKKTDTPEECQVECKNTEQCKFFTWTLYKKRCNLKEKRGDIKDATGWQVSGPEDCSRGRWFYKSFNVYNMCCIKKYMCRK